MDNEENIQDELNSLNSNLPVNTNQPLFSVPEGYFDGLASRIMAKVTGRDPAAAGELQGLSPLLASLPKNTPYVVPDGFFDENIGRLPFLFREEESPVVTAIGKELPYTVPDGYFEQLPEKIMARLVRPKAKVVPFFSRTWMRAAVAAMIGGIVFIAGYRLLNGNAEAPPETAYRPADTTQKQIAKNEPARVVQDIEKLSTRELDAFISAVPLLPAKEQDKDYSPGEKSDVVTLLKDVSEKDIEAFLDALPVADESLFVID